MSTTDVSAIRSVAVTVDDVVSALEARLRTDRPAVLRVTPPYAPRERARLHVRRADGDGEPDALHIDPRRLVDDPPPYPTVDDTADRLRGAGEYSVERHREAHAAAVADWREAVRDRIVDTLVLETPADTHEVAVKPLG